MKVLLLILIMFTSSIFAQSYKVIKHKIGDSLNVRTGPGTKFEKIGKLKYNAKGIKVLECTKIGSIWCRVNHYSTKTGWVSAKYIQKENVYTTTATNKFSKYSKYKVIRHNQGDYLNVRSGPGTSFKKISALAYNAKGIKLKECKEMYKTGKNKIWCRVSHSSINTGWVSKRYIQKESLSSNNKKIYRAKDVIVDKISRKYIDKNYKPISGILEDYYSNGNIKTRFETYKGKIIGNLKLYHSNGALKFIAPHYKNNTDGLVKSYRDDGTIYSKCYYKENLINGSCSYYYKNGKLKEYIFYVKGKKNGISKYYSKDGKLIKEKIYSEDKLVNTYYK